MAGVRLHDYGCTLKAYRRDVLTEYRLYGDMHRFIPALASWSGARIAEVRVQHHARRYGHSKYGLFRAVRVILDLLTLKFLGSYSPSRATCSGAWASSRGSSGSATTPVAIGTKIFPPHHFTYDVHLSLVAGFCATLGTLFLVLGLLAGLSIRTCHESKSKPTCIVQRFSSRPAVGRTTLTWRRIRRGSEARWRPCRRFGPRPCRRVGATRLRRPDMPAGGMVARGCGTNEERFVTAN